MMKFIQVGHLNLKYDFEKILRFFLVSDSRRNHWEPLRVFKMLSMVQLMPRQIRIWQYALNQNNSGGECGIDAFFMQKRTFYFFFCLWSIPAWHFSCEKLTEGLWCIKPVFMDGNLYTFHVENWSKFFFLAL